MELQLLQIYTENMVMLVYDHMVKSKNHDDLNLLYDAIKMHKKELLTKYLNETIENMFLQLRAIE